jgi:hypothetical protein
LNLPISPSRLPLAAPLFVALMLSACGSTRLWPFGESEGRPPGPQNAAQYQCNGGKRFYLRMHAGGDAWVILPEREFRLERTGAAPGRRYSNGAAVLELGPEGAAEATLNDGPAIAFAGCKVATTQ